MGVRIGCSQVGLIGRARVHDIYTHGNIIMPLVSIGRDIVQQQLRCAILRIGRSRLCYIEL